MWWAHHAAAVDNTRKCIRRADITPLRLRVLTRPSGQEDAGGCLWYLWAKHPKIAGSNLHHVHAVSSSVTPSPWPPICRRAARRAVAATRLLQCPRRQRPSPTVMRSSGQPGELARGRREPIDLHPGLGLPRAQLPDDCPVREEHGRFPNGGHVLGQSGGCHDVAESLPGRNPPRESANIPLTLVVPSNAGPGKTT